MQLVPIGEGAKSLLGKKQHKKHKHPHRSLKDDKHQSYSFKRPGTDPKETNARVFALLSLT